MKNSVQGVERLALLDQLMEIREEQLWPAIEAERAQTQARIEAERLLRLEIYNS